MIGLGMLGALIAAVGWWVQRKGRTPTNKWLLRAAIVAPFLPLIGISFGWIFTEMGRQPWVVFGLMATQSGVSPGVPASQVVLSLVIYALLYGALAVLAVVFLLWSQLAYSTKAWTWIPVLLAAVTWLAALAANRAGRAG